MFVCLVIEKPAAEALGGNSRRVFHHHKGKDVNFTLLYTMCTCHVTPYSSYKSFKLRINLRENLLITFVKEQKFITEKKGKKSCLALIHTHFTTSRYVLLTDL